MLDTLYQCECFIAFNIAESFDGCRSTDYDEIES